MGRVEGGFRGGKGGGVEGSGRVGGRGEEGGEGWWVKG